MINELFYYRTKTVIRRTIMTDEIKNGKLDDVKEGEYVYKYVHCGAGLDRDKVIKVTNDFVVVKHGACDVKIRKSDGYQIGSRSSGRYGSFSISHYYKETEEMKFKYRVQKVKSAITHIGDIDQSKIDVTPENIDAIIDAINTIMSFVKRSV
jgi:hypothetical protein